MQPVLEQELVIGELQRTCLCRVAAEQQLGRNRAMDSPHRVRILDRPVWMKPYRSRRGRGAAFNGPHVPAGYAATSAGFRFCCVSFACAICTRLRAAIRLGVRVSESARSIAWVNGNAPNSGLSGVSAGTDANALFANGLRSCLSAKPPTVVNRLHLKRSWRLAWPWDKA